MVSRFKNRGDSGNLYLIRGGTPTFVRVEDPELDDLPETFIDRYRNWGSTVTDAPAQYHTINGVVILSTIVAPYTFLKTSYGEIRPNVWGMILAGTTITRKSTTMDMAQDILDDLGIDFLMGTDGSPEGILSEMADRDGKVSMFHRDEITGWMENATKKDYMSGLLESFTRMYDGKPESRVLRSGKIEVKKPRLVIMCGGIKTRMQELVTMNHIRSGFIPRFIMVSGTTTPEQVRPIGPPADDGEDLSRDKILSDLQGIVDFWIPAPKQTSITVAGITKTIVSPSEPQIMEGTDDAWTRIRLLKQDAIEIGETTSTPELFTPVLDRLSNSIIKVAMLIAASRLSPALEYTDVCQAIRYSREWIASSMDFATRVEEMPDINPWERKAEKIITYIKARPDKKATRSDIMRKFHVRAKDIPDVETTLVGRGHIRIRNLPSVRGKSHTEYEISDPSIDAEEPEGRIRITKKASTS